MVYIYINNYLTLTNRNLFYKTKMYAKENSYRYAWFKNNKMLMKKNDSEKVIIIEDGHSLSNLV